MIVQVPEVNSVTAFPDTVQTAGVAERNVTASPEFAVALTVNVPVPKVRPLNGPNAMVCDCSEGETTANVCVTGCAAAYFELPPCEAVIEQVPTAIRCTVFPETVHTEGVFETDATVRNELAEAFRVKVPPTVCCTGSAGQNMVCDSSVTVIVWVTGAAAA